MFNKNENISLRIEKEKSSRLGVCFRIANSTSEDVCCDDVGVVTSLFGEKGEYFMSNFDTCK